MARARDVIETWKTPKGTLEILSDTTPDTHPRKDWDNLGTIYHWHQRYDLGTRIGRSDELPKGGVRLAVYMYDHSGICLSTKPFGDPWDSGMVGVIHADEKSVRKWFLVPDGKRVAPHIWAKAKACLQYEIETYSHYLTGDVFGFTLTPDPAPAPKIDDALLERVQHRLTAAGEDSEVVVVERADVQQLLDYTIAATAPEPEEDSCWGFIGSLTESRQAIFDAAGVDPKTAVKVQR